jgi:prepilin-type N-terminal cleavage/methylation domain-containing protein
MNLLLPIADYRLPIKRQRTGASFDSIVNRKSKIVNGFTLVEVLVTMILLSLIVLALMTVFNSTQNAFRASLTQTDILESGRLAMDMMADDLRRTTPGYGFYSTNNIYLGAPYEPRWTNGPVNFYIDSNPFNPTNQPFIQYLPGTSARRSNVLETFYMLSRRNVDGRPSWVGTGYMVDPLSYPTNSLYRFVMTTNVSKGNPMPLFTSFYDVVNNNPQTVKRINPFTNTLNWTHIMDGVVDLRVRAYNPQGFRITNTVDLYSGQRVTNHNTLMGPVYYPVNLPLPSVLKAYYCYMFSNTVPASVEVELGVMEDAVLQRAEGMRGPAQLNYLSNHVAQVHLFRQRVSVPSVDPAAYQ